MIFFIIKKVHIILTDNTGQDGYNSRSGGKKTTASFSLMISQAKYACVCTQFPKTVRTIKEDIFLNI